MSNNIFKERLYKIRTDNNLTQKELGEMLGITGKAISKWENGNSTPTFAELQKLSKILNVKIEQLISTESEKNKSIYKIAITGGPCSGKSTAMSWLQREFTQKGYFVLFVPESATELILGGITPWTVDTNLNYESYILKLQMEKEKIFIDAAKHLDNYDKVLIICDRGMLDCKAYMSQFEFQSALKLLNIDEVSIRDSYDAVFHLVSAAKGAPEFYNYNNEARQESIEEAVIQDEKTLNAWIGHPHLRVIDNSTDFEHKMRRLISEISSFLGEPDPLEIERKFLIEYPNIEKLEKMKNCTKIDIVQTYLKCSDDCEIRIRQRGHNGYYTYTKTTKKKIDDTKRLETETRLSKDEYLTLLMNTDTEKHQIRKTRYCLMHKNQYFEIDIFPFWNDKAIVEIELANENQKITFPNFLKIIKEVTNDEDFYNKNLAVKPI